MNTTTNKKVIGILSSILISLVYGVIIWIILNSIREVPAWVIPIIACWLIIWAILKKNFNTRSMLLVPMVIISLGIIVGGFMGYFTDSIGVCRGIFFGVAFMTAMSFLAFTFTANSWRFNPNIRNWKKIHQVSDIKEPNHLEKFAIKAAQWWFSHIPDSTEQDKVNMIQEIVEKGCHSFDSKDYPGIAKNIRMFVNESGINAEEYHSIEIE